MMTSLVCRGSPLQTRKPLLCLGAPRGKFGASEISFEAYLYHLWEDHNTGADKGLISVGDAAGGGVYSVVIAFGAWE